MIRNRERLARTGRHGDVLDAIETGIEAAHPRRVVEHGVRLEGTRLHVADGVTEDLAAYDEVVVLGGGNAAGHVAAALESVLGDQLDRGVVVTDVSVDTETVAVVEGTHPLPSEANRAGTERLLELARDTTPQTLVLVIVTGGASALLCAPREDIPLDEYRDVTDQLLRSGATIDEINAVRKHLSQLKGGQLARLLAPARVISLVFSDVVGNRLDVIASGPTAPDPSTFADAAAVRDRYELALSASVAATLERGLAGEIAETPGTDDLAFERVSNHVLADNRTALDAAAASLEAAGYPAQVLSSRIEGEAREAGLVHAGIAAECLASGEPFEPPVALLSGGETTVTVTGDGAGGPNQEFALGAALALGEPMSGTAPVVASVDTDGIDGNAAVAGALVDGETVDDAADARAALDRNDAGGYLKERDALVETGPTGTNVNDLRVVLVGGTDDNL